MNNLIYQTLVFSGYSIEKRSLYQFASSKHQQLLCLVRQFTPSAQIKNVQFTIKHYIKIIRQTVPHFETPFLKSHKISVLLCDHKYEKQPLFHLHEFLEQIE